MKKSSVSLLLIAVIIILIAAADFIKFNLLDVPYAGEPVTYSTTRGDIITAHFKADDSVEVSGPSFKSVHLKRSQSASGERYSNGDDSFIFWRKDSTMFIEEDGDITFRGSLKSNSPLADSIWKYTGSLINGKKEAVISGTSVIINFGSTSFFGEASCNDFFGSYNHSAEKPEQISFTDVGTTLAACEDEIQTQEEHIHNALTATTSISHTESHLSLNYATNQSLEFKLFGFKE